MRIHSASGRLIAAAVALLTAAMGTTVLAAAAHSAVPTTPAVAEQIAALAAELSRVVDQQRNGPVPIPEEAAATMGDSLDTATSLAEKDSCDAAVSMLAAATGMREYAGLADLARRAATVRALLLTDVPDEAPCEGPVDIYLDAERARPYVEFLPGFAPGEKRLLSSLSDTGGQQADFVRDELILSTSDSGRLDAFTDRWGGEVVQKLEPEGGVTQYLLRIDTATADPATLAENIKALNEDRNRAEAVAVSDATGLALLAVATAAARDDFGVGVNWAGKPDSFSNGVSLEATNGPPNFFGGTYTRNAYDWNYLRSGGPQDIGVTGAWTVLDSVGKLSNKMRIAVLDQGLSVNPDLPASTTAISVFPFIDPSTMFGSRWHGTNVANAVAGVPDNSIGSAGTAGPVARPVLVWNPGDMFLVMNAMNAALALGAKIMTSSIRVRVPWYVSFSVLPFDGYTSFITTANNVLIFSSAGNENENVDATTGWPVTWEKAWHTPCENSGVICVGGLAHNSINRDPQSNYGHEDVSIFAPFHVLVGPDPDNPSLSTSREASGTSFSTPYTAGVAALIWAAEPSLSDDEVEDILLRNMRSSPDSRVGHRVIQALDAVQDALPASVSIQTPTQGQILSPFQSTQLKATVFSDGHGTPVVTWRRNGTVVLGTGTTLNVTLLTGPQTLTATAVFPDGVQAAAAVSVSVVNHVPTVTITSPVSSGLPLPTFQVSELIPFHATSVDDLGPLPDSAVRWFLDGASTPFATGHNPVANTGAAVGWHTITARGCDAQNQCGSTSVQIAIQPNGTNQPPQVHITNPANGALLWVNGSDTNGWYHEITLTGTATDPENAMSVVAWLDNGTQIANTPTATVRLRAVCGPYNHRLTLRAIDNAGNTREDVVQVTVSLIC